jgi:hypothetical protein
MHGPLPAGVSPLRWHDAPAAAIGQKLLGNGTVSADEVAAAISGATPEQLEKLRELDREYALKLADRAIELEKLEVEDRANARAREVALKDRMPALLAIVLTVSLMGTIALLATRAVPAENREPFLILLGALSTAWTGAMSYYHGSSSSSRAKDVVLGRVAGGR